MKKIILWSLASIFLLIFQSNINSQTFMVEMQDTIKSDTLGAEMIFDFHIKNTSSSEITLNFVRTKNEIPQEWTSSLCFDFCFRNDLDSIVTNSDYGSSPLAVGEVRDFSIHVFPLVNEGEANIEVKFTNMNNLNEFIIYNLYASATITSVKEQNELNAFKLNQNYPNPFNPTTNISFNLKEEGNVKLTVFNILGNKISTITDKHYSSGFYELTFSAKDLSSGIYFYKLEVNNLIQVKKMIIGK